MTRPWKAARPYRDEEPEEPYARCLREEHVDNIRQEFIGSERSLQAAIGSSEIGWECDRRLAYRLHGTLKSNYTDPVRALTGTGWHLWLAETYQKINQRTGGYRYNVEYPCWYRNVVGHGDLYDRKLQVVFDWKTTKKDRIKAMRKDNAVPQHYKVQVNHNALALRTQQFEQPEAVALMFIPIDGSLDDTWLWTDFPDDRIVDAAIDRVDALRLVPPEQAAINPGRDCAYCAWYDPKAMDPSKACNAGKGKR